MKKLLLAFMMFTATSLMSCGNSTNTANSVDSTSVDTVQVDTVTIDSIA